MSAHGPPGGTGGADVTADAHGGTDLAADTHGADPPNGHVEPDALPEPETPPPAGPISNALIAVAVIGLGGAALLGSIALGAGSAREPDTGTWPLLVSGVLVVLGIALLALARRTHDAERFSRAGLLVLAGLATMAGFAAVLGVIGFEIPAAVLTFLWMRFLGGECLRTSIITSIAVVVAFYVVFVGLLGVPVPHMF